MAIGIGLHCWYCEHGPCNERCHEEGERKAITKEVIDFAMKEVSKDVRKPKVVRDGIIKAKDLITGDMTKDQILSLMIAEKNDEIKRLKKLLKKKKQ